MANVLVLTSPALDYLAIFRKPPRTTALDDQPSEFHTDAGDEAHVDALDFVDVREVAKILADL